MHSLAFRAMGMAGQLHRLERKLAGRDVAELLAIPALDGLRPSFWGYCVIAAVRGFTHDGAARGVGPEHLPPLPRGADRTGPVLAWARQLWALLRDPAGAVPLEHDAYLKMWHLEGAACPIGPRCSTSTRPRTPTRSPWPSCRPSTGRRSGSAIPGSRSTASAAA